jgi:acylphosphatase
MSSAESRASIRLLISGRVQGVAFRYFTRGEAQRLGLVGWVKNLPDGGVEVRATGSAGALERFRQQLRQGPPGARVDAISESELAAPEDWPDFRITY